MVATIIIMLPSGVSHFHHPLFHKDLTNSNSEKSLCTFTINGRGGKYGPCIYVFVCVCKRERDLFTYSVEQTYFSSFQRESGVSYVTFSLTSPLKCPRIRGLWVAPLVKYPTQFQLRS